MTDRVHEGDEPLIDPDCAGGKCGSCVGGPCEHECHSASKHEPEEVKDKFYGHERRECGEHRTVGKRAWCLDCSEWCSPAVPCVRCEMPTMREELEAAQKEIARLRAGEAEDPGHYSTQPTPEQWIRRFNDQTPEARKYVAEAVLKRANDAIGCTEGRHEERLAKLQEERDTFLVLLYRAVVEMHPIYANTSFRGQGIGGQAMTPGCLHNYPYTEEEFAWQAELSHTLGQHFEDIKRIQAEREKINPFESAEERKEDHGDVDRDPSAG